MDLGVRLGVEVEAGEEIVEVERSDPNIHDAPEWTGRSAYPRLNEPACRLGTTNHRSSAHSSGSGQPAYRGTRTLSSPKGSGLRRGLPPSFPLARRRPV